MKKLRGAAIPPSSLNNSESEEERTEEVSARACVYCARISLWGDLQGQFGQYSPS